MTKPDWTSYLPIVEVMRDYSRRDLPHDVVAGCILGIVTVPQAIAYAFLAGLPAEAGLYTCLVPTVIYAILGSSRHLIVGPVAVAALMVAATVGEHAEAFSNDYLDITTALCLQVGVILWLLRLFRLGGIVNLLSHPVTTGFVNAAAIIIIISQLAAFTGVASVGSGSAFEQFGALIETWADGANGMAILIGVASLTAIWLTRHRAYRVFRGERQHPISRTGPMFAVILSIALVALFDLDVATVGVVPAGLPSFTWPTFDLELWLAISPNAALISVVAYVESYTVGKTLAARRQTRINSHQELIALGAANIGAAMTGAYPVAGSFSRSGVNFAAGGRTPLSGLICAVLVVATLMWFTPLFENLPHAALATIIIVSVFGLIDFSGLREHWAFYRADVVTHFAALAAVLVFGVAEGLLVGVAISVMLFIRRSSQPHIAVVGQLGDTTHFRNVDRFDEARTWPEVAIVRIDEALYFANVNAIESHLVKVIERKPSADHLLLVCSGINFVDTSGLEMLQRLCLRLERRAVRLHLCEVKGPVRDQLRHVSWRDWLTGDVYRTTDEAIAAIV